MQVLCKATEKASDVKCTVCGQGFLVYWTRSSRKEREKRRAEILETLRLQHAGREGGSEGENDGVAAHPTSGFHLPEWDGDPRLSAAALLGNAPAWAAS